MKVTLCKFCDFACILQGGKGSVIGMFDAIYAPNFPFDQPPVHLCVEFEFDVEEMGRQQVIELALLDEDAIDLFRLRAEVQVPQAPPGRPSRLFHDFILGNMRFERPGSYRLDIVHDGRVVAEERLYISQAPQSNFS
jgi:hypothetical protein